jgi:hypothetical protein
MELPHLRQILPGANCLSRAFQAFHFALRVVQQRKVRRANPPSRDSVSDPVLQYFPLKLLLFFDLFELNPTPPTSRAQDLLVLSMENGACVHQAPRGDRDSLSLLEGRLGRVSDSATASRAQAELRTWSDFDTVVRSSPQIPRGLFTRSNPAQLYNRKSVEAFLVRLAAVSLHMRSLQMDLPRQRFSGLDRSPGSNR